MPWILQVVKYLGNLDFIFLWIRFAGRSICVVHVLYVIKQGLTWHFDFVLVKPFD
jgi:hypothetical protein